MTQCDSDEGLIDDIGLGIQLVGLDDIYLSIFWPVCVDILSVSVLLLILLRVINVTLSLMSSWWISENCIAPNFCVLAFSGATKKK